MKKLMVLMVTVLFTIGAMAQVEQKTTKQTTTTTTTTDNGMKGYDCYMMKEGTLMHCVGTKTETQKTNVTLTNGTRITTTGEVITSEGTTTILANGQCVDMKGMIGDCSKMGKGGKMDNMQGEHKDY